MKIEKKAKKFRRINIVYVTKMEDHCANGGESYSTVSTIKVDGSELPIIEGAAQAVAILKSVAELNDEYDTDIIVPESWERTFDIAKDIAYDFRGNLEPGKKKRIAALKIATAKAESRDNVYETLGVSFSPDGKNSMYNLQKSSDNMHNAFGIDLTILGINNNPNHLEDGKVIVNNDTAAIDIDEKIRRIEMVLQSVRDGVNYARQSSNATNARPIKVLISFQHSNTNCVHGYFKESDIVKNNWLNSLKENNDVYFIGDDLDPIDNVYNTFKKAIDFLQESKNNLFHL